MAPSALPCLALPSPLLFRYYTEPYKVGSALGGGSTNVNPDGRSVLLVGRRSACRGLPCCRAVPAPYPDVLPRPCPLTRAAPARSPAYLVRGITKIAPLNCGNFPGFKSSKDDADITLGRT